MGSIRKLLIGFFIVLVVTEILPGILERSETYASVISIMLGIFVAITVWEVWQDVGLIDKPKKEASE